MKKVAISGNYKYQRYDTPTDTYHDFIFLTNTKADYAVLSINKKDDLFTDKNILKKGDLDLPNARIEFLDAILKDKRNKGYKVYTGLDAYEIHIEIENEKNISNLTVVSNVRKSEPDIFKYRIKPYESLTLLKKQFSKRLADKQELVKSNAITPEEINPVQIEIALIEQIKGEVIVDMDNSVQYSITGWVAMPLRSHEKNIATQFLNWLDLKLNEIKENEVGVMPFERIKWLGSVEHFGYIFNQLITGGYIELPTTNGEGSVSKQATIFLSLFDITSSKGKSKGKPTTKENLEKALSSKRNNLSSSAKAKITIPPLNTV